MLTETPPLPPETKREMLIQASAPAYLRLLSGNTEQIQRTKKGQEMLQKKAKSWHQEKPKMRNQNLVAIGS